MKLKEFISSWDGGYFYGSIQCCFVWIIYDLDFSFKSKAIILFLQIVFST